MSDELNAVIMLPGGGSVPVRMAGGGPVSKAVAAAAVQTETVYADPDASDYEVLIMLAGICAWCYARRKTIIITGDGVEVTQ